MFFDDILVYSRTELEHAQHLGIVLSVLSKHQLVANMKKCEFGKNEMAYLGHVVSSKGVAVDKDKIQAMVDWPLPTSLRELRGFLGLTGYYRKFIKGYAQLATSLTHQLRKDSFAWSSATASAFEQLKTALSSAPVLRMPDFSIPFVIEADASSFGLGAVLMHSGLVPLGAIVFVVQKWRHYLLGRHFIIWTDQYSLKFIMEQREVGADYQKWVSKLMGYHFTIQYKPGSSNAAADAFSRHPSFHPMQLGALISTASLPWSDISAEILKDALLGKIMVDLTQGSASYPGFHLINGQLFHKNCRVLSKSSSHISELLLEYHNTAICGHSSEFKTFQRIATDWYWEGMHQQIAQLVRECLVCQQQKASHLQPAGLM